MGLISQVLRPEVVPRGQIAGIDDGYHAMPSRDRVKRTLVAYKPHGQAGQRRLDGPAARTAQSVQSAAPGIPTDKLAAPGSRARRLTCLWGFSSVSWGFDSAARSSGPVCEAAAAVPELPAAAEAVTMLPWWSSAVKQLPQADPGLQLDSDW